MSGHRKTALPVKRPAFDFLLDLEGKGLLSNDGDVPVGIGRAGIP
jgi:hypothetical protein